MNLSTQSNRPTTDLSFWKQATKSQLSGQIVRGLILAGAFELILSSAVGFYLFQSGQATEREFLLLQASSRLAVILKAGRELWEQAGELRRSPSQHAYQDYKKKYTTLLDDVTECSDALRKANVNQDIVTETEKSLTSLDQQQQEILQRQQKGDRQSPKFEFWQAQSSTSLEKSVGLIGEVHEIIRAQTATSQDYEQLVLWLVAVAFALNLAIVAYGLHLIRTRVTGPITRLAADCNRILEGQVIQAPSTGGGAVNEISSLENTFRTMSLALSEDDKRRRHFQELFRNVLSKSIQGVNNGLNRALTAIVKSGDSSTTIEKMIERCRNGLTHLQSILESLSSSLEPGTKKDIIVSREEVNVAELIERSILSVDSLVKERQISLVQDITPLAVHLDNQLIQRVITNLLSNAIKYSPIKGEITVHCEEQNNSWQLAVRDQGPGISQLERKKLFTRFGQLQSPDGAQRAGTGLGLVICQEIVEAHGGVISCESVQGSGSTFWFRLPKTGKPVPKSTVSSARTRDNEHSENFERIQAKAAQVAIPAQPTTGANGAKIAKIAKSSRAKIANYYLALLVVLICSQIATIVLLAGRFQQIHTQSAIFKNQKARFLKTQDSLTSLIKGRLKIVQAYAEDDLSVIGKTFHEIDAMLALPSTDNLTTGSEQLDKQISPILEQMNRHQKMMARLAATLPKDDAQLSKLQVAMIYPAAKKTFIQLENDCYNLLDLEQQSIRDSYTVSASLRTQIASALFLAFFLNLVVVVLAIRQTLALVRRTNLLAEKANAFASGHLPQPDRGGKGDELSWLDERFCQVAAQLQSSEEKKQGLMAVVNHDLRTPVNSILLTLGTLVADNEQSSSGDLVNALEASKVELDALFNRVNNFLLIEKLQHGSNTPKFLKLPLDGIMEGVIEMMSSRNLIDGTRLNSEMEDPDADWIVSGDQNLLEAMIVELVANAFKFSPPNSMVEIKWLAGNDGHLHLEIKNQGEGITPELTRQLFDRYRTVAGAAMPGIGLPLAARIANLHKGQLELVSNTPTACVFRVTLPFSR